MSDTAYPVLQHYGTAAERIAFTPSPGGGQPLYVWYETDTGFAYIYSTGWHQISGTSTAPYSFCQGRLTTESGVPVSSSDRTAQGTIYWTPYLGNQVGLYSGATWIMFAQAQLSLALTVTSGKNYDVFMDYNGGTPQLALSAAWTNDTTRADALALQDGINVKSGTTTLRWLGTIRASAANVTEDSQAKRFVWNNYNCVARSMKNATETTDSWNYTTAAFRQANANTANQLDYVTGDASLMVEAQAMALNTGASTVAVTTGIGVDSTTVNSAVMYGGNRVPTTGLPLHAFYKGTPGLGRHFLAWLEYSQASGTTTWYGDAALATNYQYGMTGSLWG